MSDIHEGRDGWLFLTGHDNSVLRYYTDLDYFTQRGHVEKWVERLRQRAEIFADAEIRYLHVFAPEKLSVFPEHVLLPMQFFDRHPIRLICQEWEAKALPSVLINPLPAMAAHQERDSLFMKTDTHWTYHAGQLVLSLVLQALGYSRPVSLEGRTVHRYRHVWDLGARLEAQVSEENIYVEPLPCVSRVRVNTAAQEFEARLASGRPVTHRSLVVVFRNDAADAIDERVVIFGDSFMEFRPSTPTFQFAEMFREVHFIWSPNVDYSYVARVDASVVITEVAERSMIFVPDDNYDVEADAAAVMAQYSSAE